MPDLTATGGQEPVRPPPSLIPSSAGAAVKTEEGQDESLGSAKRHRRVTSDGNIPGSSSAEVGVLGSQKATFAPGPTGPNYATAPSRSTGVKRVFDRATYDLPIANQRELSVLSLGNSTDAGRIGGGRGPRPLVLNPFARGTRFENIAAVNSLDGLITFYDINRQQKVMEIEPKESRVIPYAETLAWVSEDTLVAVSHLKHGADWAQSKKAMAAAKTEGNSFPSGEPDRFSLPETQTNLISIYYRDGILRNTVITIQGYPHEKPIQCVTAVAGEPNLMGYITAGNDKQLIHWRFTKRESGGFIGGGMANIHSIHSNTILSTMYSHTSGHLHSGGLDSRYIVYDIAHKNAVHNVKMGKIVHILQNPADPRVQAIVFSESKDSGTKKAYQYQLLDERVAGLKVLSLDHKGLSNVSKLSTPSWHTEGGLFCSGTDADGMINIWDVRWAGIRLDDASRPEAVGAVVADLSEAGIQAARAEAEAHGEGAAFDQQHPMLWSVNRRQRVISRSSLHRKGGPSQILNVGGNKIAQALFHPTRNVVMVQHFDGTLTFTDYNMITKSVV
ncbi:hypothetical protein EC991_011422 [Linnemannia zychae]|nr:hypothetical protein EC991_011422 [Linnemannia zychae]